MFANHILVVHYIWFVLYDLLMTIGWKVPCQTLNDCLSFATHPLQLRAFSHTMSDMTTKLVIYRFIDLRISSNESKNLFIFLPLNIQWSLCYNFTQIYFINFSNEKAFLNTILTSQIQKYLFPTFIIPKFLNFLYST
jgi:hypothetical protein